MAAGIQNDDEDTISDINVTPFVDIVLVLLIILMVTSQQIVRASIEIDLPKAASGGESVETTLNVVLTLADELYLNGAELSREQLETAVKEEKKTSEKLQAVVAADQGVSYGKVVEIIDILKKNGVTSLALNIERVATPATTTPTESTKDPSEVSLKE